MRTKMIFKIAMLTFKSLSTSTPAYLINPIQQKPHTKILRSSTAWLLKQQSTTKKTSKRAFRNASLAIWKSLPQTIRNDNLMALRDSDVMFFNYGLTSSSSPSHGSNHITRMASFLLTVILASRKIGLRKRWWRINLYKIEYNS